MAWIGLNGRKRHNWTTSSTTADRNTHTLARALIDGCHHLTPETEAQIDAELAVRACDNAGEVSQPDPAYLEMLKERERERKQEVDWIESEPLAADLLAIENEGI